MVQTYKMKILKVTTKKKFNDKKLPNTTFNVAPKRSA